MYETIGWNEIFQFSVDENEIPIDLSASDTSHSQSGQHQFYQLEAVKASDQTESRSGRVKLTPEQKKQKKKQSDLIYRQNKKRKEIELIEENKTLKVENEQWKFKLKELLSCCQCHKVRNYQKKLSRNMIVTFPNQPVSSFDPYQSVYFKDLDLFSSLGDKAKVFFIQASWEDLDHHGIDSAAADMMLYELSFSIARYLMNLLGLFQLSALEGSDLQNLHQNIPVATKRSIAELLIQKMDLDDCRNLSFSDFTGLDGELVKIGKFNFPSSLRPIVNRITAVHGDVSATSKTNLIGTEATYILFCASVKEMDKIQLEQVTEERILKWRDAIKDALNINFKVDFAMEHLKKIAYAYIGLMELQKRDNVVMRISKLDAELSSDKEELAKICEESKVYMDAAEQFIGKPVSSGMFHSLPTTKST